MVIVLGCMVGSGELVARYRDAPARALTTAPAAVYIGLNGVAALVALALTRVFGWSFGLGGSSAEGQRWGQVVVAGFGAMALFRTSLFIVRVGDQDVGVGPSSFLQVVLSAADRASRRSRAAATAQPSAR